MPDDDRTGATTALEALRRSSTPTVAGILYSLGFRSILVRGVQALGRCAEPMVGPAHTLRFLPTREDLIGPESQSGAIHREAFESTPRGHVLVMDCRGEMDAACCGDILVTRLMVRGGAGIVTDGGVRDSAAIAGMEMPVFARGGCAPVSRVAHFAADLGLPVCCGGATVCPGDIIMGDADGVIVVPARALGEIATKARARDELDAWVAGRIRNGAPLKGNFPPDAAALKEYEAWRGGRE